MFRVIAGLALLLTFCLPVASQQGEQYTAQVLPAPTGAPGGETRASALNNLGQVFGIAGTVTFAPPSYVPVVWTGGEPSILPFPSGSGYRLVGGFGIFHDFINDSGTVVSLVINDAVAAKYVNFGRRPVVWRNGTPTILPLPNEQICAAYQAENAGFTEIFDPDFGLDTLNSRPVGLNDQNHVLVYACGAFWIWNSGTFQLLVQQGNAVLPPNKLLSPTVSPSGNRLNNLAHAVLDTFVPGAPIGSQPLFVPAIYSLGSNTPLPVTPQPNLASLEINNRDQVLFYFPDAGSSHLELWDGTQSIDLGLGGSAALNNLGEVVFSTPFPFSSRIYKNGVISPLNIPAPLSGGFLFNDAGQIAANTSLTASQPYAVLFTPTTPPRPALGNYPDTSVPLSTDTTVASSAAPTNTTGINVSASTNFKGKLEADPNTGGVRVTDAHPAGTYTVTVTAFNGSNGPTTTKTFTLTVTTPPTCNPVSFAAAANFGVGTRPNSVAVGDFNGDGKQDLAVANSGANNVSVLLGNGAGSFSAATNFAVGSDPGSVAVGDFNGDGQQDLATANFQSSNVSILLGDGTGNFSAATNFVTASFPFSVAVGDFNRDGQQDLAVASFGTDTVSILLGDGAGSFGAATNFGVSGGPQSIAVGDFNGDGKQDLAVASTNISILPGDGAGSFGAATSFNAGPSYARDVEVGDFNGDGQQDLAVSNPSANTASVLLGDGAGGFGPPASFGVGSAPYSLIAVGDFNGDGQQDLAVPNVLSATVSILSGDGAGGFGSATNFGVGLAPFAVAVGDFNGDGQQDLATANLDANNVSILLRDCGNTPAGTNILVQPVDSTTGSPAPVTLSFSQVTGGGTTAVTSNGNNPGQPLPNRFKVGNPPTYYDITTTAQFTPPVTVCVQYPDAAYQHNESNLKLIHFNGTAWEDITSSINVQTNTVCGVTSSLSPFVVAEEDVQPPQFIAPGTVNATATSSAGAMVSYATPTASDDFDGPLPVNCSPQSGGTFALGTTEVTCAATDGAGNTTQKGFHVTVTYAWSGVLQPINADGSSIFKLGSTLPVKFALTGASAGVTNAVARLYYAKISNNVVGTDSEATSTAAASTSNLFRYDATTGQYVFNWGTKGLTTGTYQLKVDLGDGVARAVTVSLR